MEALAPSLEAPGVDVEVCELPDLESADLLVIDSYRSRADDGDRFRASVLAAVDDLARDLAVDVLIDPNPCEADPPHRRARRVLSGPRYALVRADDTEPKPVEATVEEIVVTFGAADRPGTGGSIASALAAAMPSTRTRLVVGPWGSPVAPDGVDVLHAPPDLAPILARADVVVTAGGVTLLESLLLGRPTIVVVTASNQERAARGASDAGAAIECRSSDAARCVRELVADLERRQLLANNARAHVDGRGPERVARVLLECLNRT
jgi:spore coat polysaccharide biosynthesis predicted glycosyltransferase SpsG